MTIAPGPFPAIVAGAIGEVAPGVGIVVALSPILSGSLAETIAAPVLAGTAAVEVAGSLSAVIALPAILAGESAGTPPPLPPGVRAPSLTEDDFLGELQDLLPRGRAWPRDPDTVLTKLLSGFAKAQAEAHGRQVQLLAEVFPATTEELLPEWEASLGLPDPCLGPNPLDSERRQQVVARLTSPGGQSIPYFTQYAQSLGVAITIEEFSAWHVGMAVGLPLLGIAWNFHWEVTIPAFPVHYFTVGEDTAGDPLADWTSTPVTCELQRLKPGHTTLSFNLV